MGKNHERMQALIDQLQGKVKSYKKQIEEAEEIAALNLAKYRKVAGALGDAEASADGNEEGPRQVRLPRSLRNCANQSRLTTLQPTNIFPAKFQLICGANHFVNWINKEKINLELVKKKKNLELKKKKKKKKKKS